MELFRNYLEKHAAGDRLINAVPEKDLKFIIVIPSYLETRLEESLVSLFNASPPASPVEVIIVVNWPEDASQEHIDISHESFRFTEKWISAHSGSKTRFHVAEAGFIPRKKAGVGYARKTGMDEAVRRFELAGQENGIIISFDADTSCDTGYLQAIEEHFNNNPLTDGCSVYFEHPLEGRDYPPEVYEAITQYEIHMRYYLHAIKYSGFPNAFYTVGSAFAITAASYCRQGGMNARQAGEDFYFLQKFFELGNFSDLLKTRVCPSPRPSLRVPFGTGKAIDQLLKSGTPLFSYNPETFDVLKDFFGKVPWFFSQLSETGKLSFSSLHPVLTEFLEESGSIEEILNIFNNSGSIETFTKRFYRYFNMFRILKFARYSRKVFPDQTARDCAISLMAKTGMRIYDGMCEKEILLEFRKRDRGISDQQ